MEDMRGYTADSKYDVEMKLHIASQPLFKFMNKIEHDILGEHREPHKTMPEHT